MSKTAQEKCDQWNREHGFEPAKTGPRVVHHGFNRKARRDGTAGRWINDQMLKKMAMRSAEPG